jgi:hypothetical protein
MELSGFTHGWPDSTTLSSFGLAGMPVPADAENIQWGVVSSFDGTRFLELLEINWIGGTFATDAAVDTWLNNNGWTGGIQLVQEDNGGQYYYYEGDYSNNNFQASYLRKDTGVGGLSILLFPTVSSF